MKRHDVEQLRKTGNCQVKGLSAFLALALAIFPLHVLKAGCQGLPKDTPTPPTIYNYYYSGNWHYDHGAQGPRKGAVQHSQAADRATVSQYDWTAIGTGVLAILAFFSFWVQLWFSKRQLQEARNEIAARFHLQMTERFESDRMRQQRKTLAVQYLQYLDRPEDVKIGQLYPQINEDVLNFFDNLGGLLHRGRLDETLTHNAFCYYTKGWWSVCASYVTYIRNKDNDPTHFSAFQDFAERMFELDAEKRNVPRAELELDAVRQRRFLGEEQTVYPG
jgi:hypothetical protein